MVNTTPLLTAENCKLAHTLLFQATAQLNAPREAHAQIAQALNVFAALIAEKFQVAFTQPETPKP